MELNSRLLLVLIPEYADSVMCPDHEDAISIRGGTFAWDSPDRVVLSRFVHAHTGIYTVFC